MILEMPEPLKVEPMCPNCSTKPMSFAESTSVAPSGAVYKIAWCAACGHVLTFQFIAQQSAIAIPGPAQNGRLII